MADQLDVLTLAEAKTAINMPSDNTDHDTELAQYVTAISRLLDRECGPVVQRTITDELHHDPGQVVTLRHTPVVSIGTVQEAFPGEVTTLAAGTFGSTGDGYRAEQDWRGGTLLSGVLERQWQGYVCDWPYNAQVKVTYTAGRFEDTGSVDAQFKACAGAILRRLWKRESGAWAQSSDFFETLDVQTSSLGGFFKVAKPIIDEMLWAETRMVGHG